MSKDNRVFRRGQFSGKKITFAATDQIESFTQLASEFMEIIFDLEPGDYLITDESTLLDFTDFDSSDTSEFWTQITEHYGIGLQDVGSEYLVRIFGAIVRRRNVQ